MSGERSGPGPGSNRDRREAAQDLLQNLVADLKPVRRLPALSTALAVILVAFALAAAADVKDGGPLPHGFASGWTDARALLLTAGLAALALGGLLVVLAGAVPGRESLYAAARASALTGLAVAGICAAWPVVAASESVAVMAADSGLGCLQRGALLGLFPTLTAWGFAAWGAERRPLALGFFAGVGGAGLSAVFVHASCPGGGPLHVLLGHGLAPLLIASLLTLPGFALQRGLRALRT